MNVISQHSPTVRPTVLNPKTFNLRSCDKEKQQIPTIEKLELLNVWLFCLKNNVKN